MPLDISMIGLAGPGVSETLEDRWLMNYAASVGDENPVYLDNRGGKLLPAHPAYLSHLEWEAIVGLHECLEMLLPEERDRGVHSYNDTEIIRPLRSGDKISCVASVESVFEHPAGACLGIRVNTRDGNQELVASSLTQIIYRGVPLASKAEGPAPVEYLEKHTFSEQPDRSEKIVLSPIAAHVFSECARDYNPIHTDIAVAESIDLPGLILHGTGTFALVVSSLVNHEAKGHPQQVQRFVGRLAAMVLCPSEVTLNVYAAKNQPSHFRFELLTDANKPAISSGYFALAEH
ncbi:MaoC family dehydratase N-terminal domain-containing protein [Marinobacter sp. 1-3A]|uniref:MaoC/PaaZ C-terminal domain-containing protein n=1 Tax=unclassified Marinobacter TaxID=83889 RepID=UPI001904C1BA|nr:MaoC/PaaZ C-terminal domain-containing protein [Marinobacter sp. 1-3A]MBK1874994.1 MaoC family dehydratase N-terminal domain-containing protein [Marinobacter sp. 1-3A]